MKYDVRGSNNLVVIAGKIGNIKKVFNDLVNISVANNLNDNSTEWLNLNFSNPNNNFNGVDWADYAIAKLQKGMFVLAVCYKKQKGDYMNYYVNSCNHVSLYDRIPNTQQYAIVGKTLEVTPIKDGLTEVKVLAANKEIILTFQDTEKFNYTKFAQYLPVGQVFGGVFTREDKDGTTKYYANRLEYGNKIQQEN